MKIDAALALVSVLANLIETAVKNNKPEITREDLAQAVANRGIAEADWASLAPKP